MADFLELRIITVQEIFYEGIVREVYFEGEEGLTGILIDHHPYIALVKEGVLSFRDLENKEHLFYVGEGFVNCYQNRVEFVLSMASDSKRLDLKQLEAVLEKCRNDIARAIKGELSPQELEELLFQEKVLARKIRVARTVS